MKQSFSASSYSFFESVESPIILITKGGEAATVVLSSISFFDCAAHLIASAPLGSHYKRWNGITFGMRAVDEKRIMNGT